MSKGGKFEWVDCGDCMVLLFYFILCVCVCVCFVFSYLIFFSNKCSDTILANFDILVKIWIKYQFVYIGKFEKNLPQLVIYV
jgi:hypothetical protein